MGDGLDRQLATTRDCLQRQIRQPELARVRARADQLRHRRAGLTGAASVLALVLVIGLAAVFVGGLHRGPEPVATSGPDGSRWSGGGLTVFGLNGPVLDLPGTLADVEFADPDDGYALAVDCPADPCTLALAGTNDAGHTWTREALPTTTARAADVPRLMAVDGGLFLAGPDTAWYRPTGGTGWQSVANADPDLEAVPAGGRLGLWPDTCGGDLLAWQSSGRRARLAGAPGLTVCSVAVRPGADGAWWVGGRQDDAPTVAVSRDDGRTWIVIRLPAGPGTAVLSALGNRVFATVVTERGGDPYPETLTVPAVYRSVDSGPFTPYLTTPATLIGDVVPLLDGRLLAAGPDWQLTDGSAFTPVGGSLPWLRRFARTPGAWVAYDLFRGGWAAVSTDGVTWQKLNLR
jgi:hypothetical protein